MYKSKVSVPEMEVRVSNGLVKRFDHPNGKYVGWCYTQKCQFEKAWDEHTISARGVVTLKDGTIVSRPYNKFFNMGEPEAEPIPWNENIEVTEKIDGSLIVVGFYRGEMIVNSKGSFTSEHAEFAKKWLSENCGKWVESEQEKSDQRAVPEDGWTFCFEAIFPETNENDVKVINYGDKADLTLLSILHTISNQEIPYNYVKTTADVIGCPIIQRHDIKDIHQTIADVKKRNINGGEGIVIRFVDSNKRIKIKSDEYIRLHRLIGQCSPKHVLDALVKGDHIETIYGSLPDELFNEIKGHVAGFKGEYNDILERAKKVTALVEVEPDRRTQASVIMKDPESKEISSVVFAMLDSKDYNKPIWGIIRKKHREELCGNDVSRV